MQNRIFSIRVHGLRAQASAAAIGVMLAWGGMAFAQDTVPAQASQPTADASVNEPAGGEIVVTGSRVARAGFQQPTPTTIVDSTALTTRGPSTIADSLNQLPALSGSVTPRGINNTTTGGTGGANLLNLRNLGVNRTLVLLDGRRVVPSTVTGAVDVNLLPSNLVQRVEIVTGGASAAYGSDAVAGVVNFILNDNLRGLTLSGEAGISQEGDASSTKASLAYGGGFADDRITVLASASYEKSGSAGPAGDRNWYKGYKFITNPAYTPSNGVPQFTVLPNVGTANATAGGLVTSGPLRGTQFLPGGPAPFNFGFAAGQLSVGGDATDDAQYNQLQAPVANTSLFGHVSFDATDNLKLYAEAQYGRSTSNYYTVPYFKLGSITIRNDNPYLDATTLARMATAGVTSIAVGSSNRGLGPVEGYNRRTLSRFVGGAKGELAGFKWDVYYQHGESRILNRLDNDAIASRYTLAVDAVRNGAGQIVCRSSLTAPNNGCVPLNIFGGNNASPAAADYIYGSGFQSIVLRQDVVSGEVSGTPFSSWAGPVSIAAGAEYRSERYRTVTDSLSAASAFFVGNYQPSHGRIGVKEAFLETVFPLISNGPLSKKVEFNGAVRVTDYTVSGTVETWKLGLSWEVNNDLRFRGTRSRDIRAPNLNDVFQGGSSLTATVVDPVTQASYFTQQLIIGNRALRPERADTTTLGAVLTPSWLPGFSASVDYYKIKIKDAIVTLQAQDLLNRCIAGNTDLCQYVIRNSADVITQIQTPGLNASAERTSGIDFELSYRTALEAISSKLPGELAISALGNWVKTRSVSLGGIKNEYAGALSDATAVPDWRWLVNTTYRVGNFATTLTGRYIGSGVISNDLSSKIVDNHVPATVYFDLQAQVTTETGGHKMVLFGAVSNLLNQSPRVTPPTFGNTFAFTGTNPLIYDVIGRSFRVGARVSF